MSIAKEFDVTLSFLTKNNMPHSTLFFYTHELSPNSGDKASKFIFASIWLLLL